MKHRQAQRTRGGRALSLLQAPKFWLHSSRVWIHFWQWEHRTVPFHSGQISDWVQHKPQNLTMTTVKQMLTLINSSHTNFCWLHLEMGWWRGQLGKAFKRQAITTFSHPLYCRLQQYRTQLIWFWWKWLWWGWSWWTAEHVSPRWCIIRCTLCKYS